MAVQARHLSHAFLHDLHAFRAMDDVGVVPGTAFFDEYGLSAPAPGLAGTPVLAEFPRSGLTCNYGIEPRKRPRVTAEAAGFLEDRSVVLPPAVAQELVAAVPVGNGKGRAAGSGTASTSGRLANGAAVSHPQTLLSRLCYHQDAEIDALLTLESERMRAVLEAARRRHARALLAAVERAASGRLRAAEAELERALRHNAELEEKARQMAAECQAWIDVAQSHEAVAAGLRPTLDQLLQSPRATAGAIGDAREGDAEDAQSCCFEAPAAAAGAASRTAASSSCRACGCGDACVLLLPCRHLCLCLSCEAAVDACPICAAAKNASLHVLLS